MTWIESEEYNKAHAAHDAYIYAREVLKAPYPEGEAAISQDAEYSYHYACDVLKAPFPLGEAAISKYAQYSYMYAKEVLKGRFIEGEKAIAQNIVFERNEREDYERSVHEQGYFESGHHHTPGEYPYSYAIFILKAPFPDGEWEIALDQENVFNYIRLLYTK